jgi:hypothetical protein
LRAEGTTLNVRRLPLKLDRVVESKVDLPLVHVVDDVRVRSVVRASVSREVD